MSARGSSRFKITKANESKKRFKEENEGDVISNHEVNVNIQDEGKEHTCISSLESPNITFKTPSPDLSSYDGNLALYVDDINQRGKIQNFIRTVSSYSAAIPAPDCNSDVESKPEVAKLGTLVGVYLPCIQNILGVILFIRLSWIVGTAGIMQSFFIVFTCCCCTMLTAISMSAIATNGVVPAGGSYFMISRSLGPEFGGAVGVLFYLGTSFASSMYILGAVEILLTYIAPSLSLFGDIQSTDGSISTAMLNNMRVYGSILVVLMGGLVFIGVKYVNKCASLFLACVLLSIAAIFIGFFSIHARTSPSVCYVGNHLLSQSSYDTCNKNDSVLVQLYQSDSSASDFFNMSSVHEKTAIPGITSGLFSDNVPSYYRGSGDITRGREGFSGEVVADMTTSFTTLLAIFFPSVTGIMAGSNRSGNLQNAQYSIPRGTIAAILTTSTLYLLSVLFLGATVNSDVLRDKFGDSIGGAMIVSKLAWPNEWVILIGSLLSTIGAGLQSLTGAPRLLQAISNDGIIPFLRVFSTVSKDGEPKRALLITLFISEIGVLIANLDSVAPIITMFFLMCYGFVNFACALQSLLRLPNWRPRFRFYHWLLSVLGVCLCFALMIISSWYYALVAIFLAGFLYKYIEYQGAQKEWGDGLSGLALSAARFGLLRLQGTHVHTKNWRPQLLVLCGTGQFAHRLCDESKKLISIASQLKTGRGLTVVGAVAEISYLESTLEVDELEEEIKDEMEQMKVKGFHTVVASPHLMDGMACLIQATGLGGLKPNTVMVSWPHDWKNNPRWQSFIHSVRMTSQMKRALVVVKNADLFPDLTCREEGNIDIWWIVHDGGLMLLMMFLLRQHKVWRKCNLRLFTVAQINDNSIQIKKDLSSLIYNLRIHAEIEVIELNDSDISAYTYERTLKAEERKQMVNKMKLSRSESKKEAQLIFDKGHRPRHQPHNGTEHVDSIRENAAAASASDTPNLPNEDNVRKMDTAVKINKLVLEKSSTSRLVMINLPKPPRHGIKEFIYMEFIEVLTEGLQRVFLVRGGGHEVVTIYS
ncbi:solute carrier family 12 member 4-like [Hydractinia symbiolongicarpus]|uniref:solute carrier family 12 member 4-like n=1 Tax=Hydractinia symbiolongicarpus TaxID=13093 RepID=UPI002550A6FD|nr:solute carrier family 12 member 4-like [Hydractinia symbiolongicarpus]